MKKILLIFILVSASGIYAQKEASQTKFLSLFKTIDLPLKFDADEGGIDKPSGNEVSTRFQKQFMNMNGHNEDGYGTHVSAIGKIDLGSDRYALIYSYIVVPIPAVFDESGLMIFDLNEGKIEDIELAYLRGAVGADISTMTCIIDKKGNEITIDQKLNVETSKETEDGITEGPTHNYSLHHSIKKGKLKKGEKKKQ